MLTLDIADEIGNPTVCKTTNELDLQSPYTKELKVLYYVVLVIRINKLYSERILLLPR